LLAHTRVCGLTLPVATASFVCASTTARDTPSFHRSCSLTGRAGVPDMWLFSRLRRALPVYSVWRTLPSNAVKQRTLQVCRRHNRAPLPALRVRCLTPSATGLDVHAIRCLNRCFLPTYLPRQQPRARGATAELCRPPPTRRPFSTAATARGCCTRARTAAFVRAHWFEQDFTYCAHRTWTVYRCRPFNARLTCDTRHVFRTRLPARCVYVFGYAPARSCPHLRPSAVL